LTWSQIVDVVVSVDGDGDVRRGRERIALGTVSPHIPRNAGLAHARAAAAFSRLCDLEKGVVNGQELMKWLASS
jgi:hypothetical protein